MNHSAGGGWGRAAWVAGWLALLAGCGPGGPFAPAPPPVRAPAPRVVRPAARPAPPRPSVPLVLPNLPATEQAAPPQQADVPEAALPEQPGSRVAEPGVAPVPSLAGLSAARVEALLGAPAERAPSGVGERWRYRGPGCTVDLFLFPGVGSGGLVVLDRRATGADEQACLRRMREGAP